MARGGYTDLILAQSFSNLFRIEGHEERQRQQHGPQFPEAGEIERIVRADLHLPHQVEFLNDTSHRILGLVAGFGAGKTRCLVGKSVLLAIANPGCLGIIMEPTNTLVRTLIIPELTNRFQEWGVVYEMKLSPLPEIKLYFNGFTSTLYLRSFENWNRIRGDNAAFALIDEFDTVDKANGSKGWNMIQGRVRAGQVRQIGIVSTPEGFGLMHTVMIDQAGEDRRLIRARTRDNPYLPPDYIQSLLTNYPPELITAYLEGEFVNLGTGTVYIEFSRTLNHTDRELDNNDHLFVGCDFNVGRTSAVVHVLDGDWPRAVDEFHKVRDTTALIEAIKSRYASHLERGMITVYPDASGGNRHTSASRSDIELLRLAGLRVDAPKANPPIKDRVLTMNVMFHNALDERRYLVNTKKCKEYTRCLEQQSYTEDGLPDKTSQLDHLLDAAGYFIHRRYSFIHARAGSGTGIRVY